MQYLMATGTAFLEEANHESLTYPTNNTDFIEATGRGFPAPNAFTPDQKKLTALEAARYGAIALLMETIKGVEINKHSLVQNMMFAGEEISATLSGSLQGATAIKDHYDPETAMAEVTLRVYLDADGATTPHRPVSYFAPASLYQRKANAEAAARINAAAALKQKIGKVYLTQITKVEDQQLTEHKTELYLDGMLEDIAFSPPRWVRDKQCEVTASLVIDILKLKK
jgi:hypothetical protein